MTPRDRSEQEPAQSAVRRLEDHAEHLVACQLDLLAQMEAQLRAAHRLMRHIEKLRGRQHRVGPELTPPQRSDTLTSLEEEVAGIDGELRTQHQCLAEMHSVIEKMRVALEALVRSMGEGGRAGGDQREE